MILLVLKGDAMRFCSVVMLLLYRLPSLDELTAFRRKLLGTDKVYDSGEYDLVVVGGGIAGTCAAVSGARNGLKVALVQDRPVLGGNNSSEVRVWLQGRAARSHGRVSGM